MRRVRKKGKGKQRLGESDTFGKGKTPGTQGFDNETVEQDPAILCLGCSFQPPNGSVQLLNGSIRHIEAVLSWSMDSPNEQRFD